MGKSGMRAVMHKKKILNSDSNDLGDILAEIINPSSVDPHIVLPKYKSSFTGVTSIYKFLKLLSSETGIIATTYPEFEISDMFEFANNIQKDIEPFIDINEENVGELWTGYRNSKAIKDCISIYSQLLPYKSYLTETSPSDKWIRDMTLGVALFDFSHLSISAVWQDMRTDNKIRDFILTIISRLFLNSKKVYDFYVTPDIDVDVIRERVMETLDSIKDVPELSRCKNAMKAMSSSMNLFNDNINDYFKSFIQTGNPITFMEEYVVDVINNQETKNPKLLFELSQLRKYLSRIGNDNKKVSPKIREMLKKIGEKLDEVDNVVNQNMKAAAEKENPNLVNDNSESEED